MGSEQAMEAARKLNFMRPWCNQITTAELAAALDAYLLRWLKGQPEVCPACGGSGGTRVLLNGSPTCLMCNGSGGQANVSDLLDRARQEAEGTHGH